MTDDELIALAKQDRPILREELGIQSAERNDGFYIVETV